MGLFIVNCVEGIIAAAVVITTMMTAACVSMLMIIMGGWIFHNGGYEKICALLDRGFYKLTGGKQNVESKYKR